MSSATDRFSIAGKVALVTGASRGIGRAIALAFAESGADLVLVSRTEADLAATADLAAAHGVRSVLLPADVGDLDAVATLADRAWAAFGRVDIVVPAAGIQIRKAAHEFTPADIRQMLDIHLASPFLLTSALGARQRDAGIEGRHIFIASLASRIGLPNVVPYAAAKSGVVGVVHGLAREWAATGITVNAVLPGYFETELTKTLFADPARLAWVMSRIPMGRLGDVDDVASACLFLASPAARYVTGEVLTVDGGWLAS